MSAADFALYGTGRAGLALASAMLRAGLTGVLWTRSPQRAQTARLALGQRVSSGLPPADPKQAPLVVLAVSDAAITSVVSLLVQTECLAHRPVVAHISGALGLDCLLPAKQVGCPVGSLHPLRSLLGQQTSLTGALCAVDGDTAAIEALQGLAGQLACPTAKVPSDKRRLYHAAACMAGNDIVGLLASATVAFEAAGLEPSQAMAAVIDLAGGVLQNISRHGPASALTGPVVRGDAEIIDGHLSALSQLQPQLAKLHHLLSCTLLELAADQGVSKAELSQVQTTLDTFAQKDKVTT